MRFLCRWIDAKGKRMSDKSEQKPGTPKGPLVPFFKMLDQLAKISIVISGVSLVVLTVIFGWLVFGRYVLNATPTWVEQVSLLLVGVITFLGAAVGIHDRTHLCVTMFREKAPIWLQKTLARVDDAVMAMFGGAMAWFGFELLVFKWGSDIPLIHIPEGTRMIALVACGVLIVLFSIGHFLRPHLQSLSEAELVEQDDTRASE